MMESTILSICCDWRRTPKLYPNPLPEPDSPTRDHSDFHQYSWPSSPTGQTGALLVVRGKISPFVVPVYAPCRKGKIYPAKLYDKFNAFLPGYKAHIPAQQTEDFERCGVLMWISLGGGLARVIIRAVAQRSRSTPVFPRLSAYKDHITLKSSCLSEAAASFILPTTSQPARTASFLSCRKAATTGSSCSSGFITQPLFYFILLHKLILSPPQPRHTHTHSQIVWCS